MIIERGKQLARDLLDRVRTHREVSYSQDGEDRLLWHLFQGKQGGYYVDVGAHHPKRFSNTYLFYEAGWRGLNVDPVPGTRERFRRVRPRDTTLECGVSDERGELTYYMFEEPAYNSFNPEVVEVLAKRSYPRSLGSKQIPVHPLRELLREHLPPGQGIDFLTVDAEGWDMKVLASNDWTKYRPKAVVAEDGTDVQSSLSSPLGLYLRDLGYTLVSRTNQSVIWVDR